MKHTNALSRLVFGFFREIPCERVKPLPHKMKIHDRPARDIDGHAGDGAFEHNLPASVKPRFRKARNRPA